MEANISQKWSLFADATQDWVVRGNIVLYRTLKTRLVLLHLRWHLKFMDRLKKHALLGRITVGWNRPQFCIAGVCEKPESSNDTLLHLSSEKHGIVMLANNREQ